jgi:D-alanyl-D-alanine endopeptidase (penicillin-binding protein 7)
LWDIDISKTGYIREAGKCLIMQTTVMDKPIIMVFLKSYGKYTRTADAKRVRKWLESVHVQANLASN